MAKRKVSAVLPKKTKHHPDISESDSEPEYQKPKKRINIHLDNVQFNSTPYGDFSASHDGPSTSHAAPWNGSDTAMYEDSPADCNYANFQSFLQSHNFLSDDESDLLTVSQLAEKRPCSPVQNETPRRLSTVKLNNSRNTPTDFSPDSIRVMSVPCKHLEIVALHHPASLTLHGFLKVTALVGSVSILGYNVKEDDCAYVFSSKLTGYKKITTKMSAHHKTAKKLYNAMEGFAEGEKSDVIEEFVDCVGSSTVVVVLERALLPPPLQFLELYHPNAVEMDTPPKGKEVGSLCSVRGSGVIEISQDAELIAHQLSEAICSSGATGYRVVVHGAKQSGKSSLLRYLMHTVLNTRSAVYYLDADPGQTEFTPPGVVSLTKVEKPLLGPPYTHQRNPEQMIFTGSVTPATSPPMYSQCVLTLIKYYDAHFRNDVLFVNTMGWNQGMGEVCFEQIKAALKPTMLIDFLPSNECPQLKMENTQGNVTLVQIPAKQYPAGLISYSSKDMRNFTLMSYFGKCQKFYMQPTYLNAFRPVCINWNNIVVYVMGKRVLHQRLIEAIHSSIVALCCVDESLILEGNNPEYPKTLIDESINKCLGFGLVRAADEAQHLLYIVTPLPLEQLDNVNALIKGNIMAPDEVFFKQPILNIPLPYTDVANTAPASNRKSVKKRQFIPQQTPKNR